MLLFMLSLLSFSHNKYQPWPDQNCIGPRGPVGPPGKPGRMGRPGPLVSR